jgi:transcriptional regulator with GAF, ATPase, and Fis domain
MSDATKDAGPSEPKTDLLKHLPLSLIGKRARPQIAWHDAAGEHTRVLDRRVLIGTSEHLHAVVNDRSVSRLHAEFEVREGGVWVRDLGSTNGTWVNGVLVRIARVAEGDTLRLGGVTVRVDYTPPAENVALWPSDRFGPMLGRSEVMRELFVRMAKYVESDAPILLTGETGTGKSLAARAIHDLSPRAKAPFVVVDCAGLSESSLDRADIDEAAHGGTLLLDEVSELTPSLQPKVLGLVEAGARIIAATRADLETLVTARAFREELYFRLAVLPLELPPLRERRDDAILLLEHWLAGTIAGLDEETKRTLLQHPWNGNVRELRNFAERVKSLGLAQARAVLDEGRVMEPPASTSAAGPPTSSALPLPPLDVPFKTLREAWVDHLERTYVSGLMRLHGRNVGAVAEAAGLDRSYVHRLIRKHVV